jgi:beta-phosphoglucomutase
MNIDAIVFDMDGVLIDAREWHYESLNKALDYFGVAIDRDEHLNTFDGLPTKTKLDMLSKQGRLPEKVHTLINKLKQKFTYEFIVRDCVPRFEHEYALSRLKRDGYKIGLASNSIKDSVDLMMLRSNLHEYFDVILSTNDVVNPKPHPEIYLTAQKRLDVVPGRCLVVEDNPNGVAAATASGAHVLVVKNPDDVSYKNILNKIKSLRE